MVGPLLALAVLGSTAPAASEPMPWLTLEHAALKTTSASLLVDSAPEAPRIFDQVLMGDIRLAMTSEMARFANEMLPQRDSSEAAGSGDEEIGGFAFLCGLLGFFPGFGIGHLIAGSFSGFVLFLVIDIVIAGVFFIVFPFWGFAFWYLASLVVILVERVVEAFSAANAAYRYRGYHGYYADSDGALRDGPLGSLDPVKAAFTIFDF